MSEEQKKIQRYSVDFNGVRYAGMKADDNGPLVYYSDIALTAENKKIDIQKTTLFGDDAYQIGYADGHLAGRMEALAAYELCYGENENKRKDIKRLIKILVMAMKIIKAVRLKQDIPPTQKFWEKADWAIESLTGKRFKEMRG